MVLLQKTQREDVILKGHYVVKYLIDVTSLTTVQDKMSYLLFFVPAA